MTKKWLLAFALAGLSIASAKTYSITIGDPSLVGSSQLKPGDYTLKLQGSTAVLTDTRTGKEVEANVKVANSQKKFEYTEIESRKTGGANRIEEIRLGGTRMKVDFN